MNTKSKITIAFCLLSILSFSQGMFYASEKVLNKLKESKLQVVTGYVSADKEAKLKEALEKYWDFCPIEFVDKSKEDKNRLSLMLADYEINSWTHYTYTSLSISNSVWVQYNNNFDNLTVKNQVVGIDKTDEEVKSKIELAILTLSGQVKFLYNSYKENRKLKGWKGNTEKIKTTTILIPKEYLSNGLTKNAFKKLPKHEFMPLKEIIQKLNSENKEGYGALLANKTTAGSTLEIFDLTTGEFIYYYTFGAAFQKGMTGTPDKITDKEIIEGIEKIEK